MSKETFNILLVEDNPGDARLVQEALTEAGTGLFNLVWVVDLAKGSTHLKKNQTDVILLDLTLPDSTGMETFKKIHAMVPQIPIVLLTGQDDERLASRMVQEGAEDFIVKGQVNGSLLVRSIRYAIERTRAKKDLAESERHYRDLFENAGLAAFQSTPEGKILAVNHAFARMFGYASNKEVTTSVKNAAKVFANPKRRQEIERLIAENPDSRAFENAYRRKDGSTFTGSLNVRPVKDDEGRLLYYEGFIEDLTERKRMEQAVYLMSDTQQQIAHLENVLDVFQLVGKKVHELIGNGYVGITVLDEPQNAMKIGGIYGFGSMFEDFLKRYKLDQSSMEFPLKDISDEELRLFRSGRLEKFENGLYHLLVRKVPKRICTAIEKELGFEGIYTMGFVWEDIHYGGITVLAKSDIAPFKGMIETIMNQATVAMKRIQSEETLMLAEQKYRTIFENAMEGIHQTTEDGKIISVNPAGARMLGYDSPADLMTSFNLVHNHFYVQPGRREEFQRLMKSQGSISGFESEVYRKDNSTAWISESSHTVLDEQGNLIYYEGSSVDITERKLAEQAVKLGEARYQNLVETQHDIIARSDLSGNLTFINDAYCHTFGKTRVELLGNDYFPTVLADDLPITLAAIEEIKKPPYRKQTETRHPTVEGLRWISWENSAVLDDSGNIFELQGVGRDITERKQAEQVLKESEGHYRGAIEAAGLVPYEIDYEQKRFSFIGENIYKLTGYPADEFSPALLKERVLETQVWGLENIGVTQEEAPGKFLAGEINQWGSDLRLLTRSGEERWISDVSVPLPDKSGKVTRAIGIFQDQTERKRAEMELQTRQADEKYFSERLAVLSEVTTDLSKADTLDAIFHQAVEMGRKRLDFDRMSIWMICDDRTAMQGTFGVDLAGRITDERKERFVIGQDFPIWSLIQGEVPLIHMRETPLYSNGQVVGQGSQVFAGLWDGTNMIGYFSVDNLRRQRSFSDRECEVIRLYSSAVGHLISLKRTEETLRTSEASLQVVLQSTAEGILAVGIDNEVLYANERFAEMWKIPPEIIASRDDETLLKFVLNELDDPQSFLQKVQALYKSDEESIDTLYFKDGRIFDRVSRPMLQRKQLRGRVWSFRDVTEKTLMEEKLVEERTLLRTLMDNLPDRVYVMDTQGRKILSNIADWQASGGKSMEDVIGKTDLEMYPPELANDFWVLDRSVIDNGIPIFNREEPGLDSKGNPVKVLSSKVPLRDGQGRIIGLVGIGRDITMLKQAQETLAKTEHIYRQAITQTGSFPYQRYYNEDKYAFLGEGFERLTGYTPEEMTGPLFTSRLRRIESYGDNKHMSHEERVKKALKGEIKEWREDYVFERKDSKLIWLADHAVPVYGDAGDVVGTLGILTDITESKQTELQQAHQAEELARLYRASASLLTDSPFDLDKLAQIILKIVLDEFRQTNCSLFLVENNSDKLNRIACMGPYVDQVTRLKFTLDGPGLVPHVVRTGNSINARDVRENPLYIAGWELARSELTIPLKVGNKVIGAIDVQSTQPGFFSEDDERLMAIFAERAALALEHARLYTQTEHRLENLTALRVVDTAIASSFDIKFTLGILLDQVTKQLGIEAANIMVFNPASQTVQLSVAQGFRTSRMGQSTLQLGENHARQVVRERRTIAIEDLTGSIEEIPELADLVRAGFTAYLGVPLIAKGVIKGVLEIYQSGPIALDQDQRSFLDMLAGQAAIAIESAQLFENLQGSNVELMMAYDETIEGWSQAMDLRDKETEGHSRRVTEMTVKLAANFGSTPEELIHIRRGALLHDIGKLGVPDEILRNPKELTDEEWTIMHEHPQFAYNMLAPITYLHPALDIPFCHHEKWDGSGYPRGLKGNQIPLAARIFAVVDVWDALTSDRTYREAWTKEEALTFIQEQSGKHFDPRVVSIFIREVADQK